MKRTLFTTAILLSFLSSCQKETSSIEKEMEPILFTACIAESADTKVSVDCTAGKVSWVAGDSIFISNGSETKTYIADNSGATTTFTVKESSKPAFSEAARYSATYGTMPTPGAAQQYSATPGALVYMEAPKTESTSTPDFTFEVKCGLLKLNLTAADKSVKRISVSDGTSTYSLVCETAQSIVTATDFYIALPAGSYTKYIIRDSEGYEAVKTAKPTGTGTGIESNKISKVTFNILNFAAPKYTEGVYTGDGIKIGSTWWAPVNCGYVAKTGDSGDALGYPYGKLYQWGRKCGQGYYKDASKTAPKYEDATYPSGDNIKDSWDGANGAENPACFYKGNSSGTQTAVPYKSDWITNGSDTFWNLNEGTANPVSKNTSFDPCPDGWRVPTYNELNALFGENYSTAITAVGGQNGCYFNGTSSASSGVFLPLAGCRSYDDVSACGRGSDGSYWSSSVKDNKACSLTILGVDAFMDDSSRASGISVRCVQE